ncbi:hypothetical protein [Thiomonas sp. FB-Cd]|uniref:hypothetical protein n=1 Tax=Thiomonas sp. FB-Cd TaxID=1158292 RepID=UPI0006908D6F|nr:hypothetical protein [Thiomonas sp. FB-Cd]
MNPNPIDPLAIQCKRYFDVCNGDADGLCAVLQWRLATPAPAELITGLKRQIDLLGRVHACSGDEVLVCDLSMQRNRPALMRLLQSGVRVKYFDHHDVHDVPRHPGLLAHIDGSPSICTSLLVDRYLAGRFRAWAVVGAYGDNLHAVADEAASTLNLSAAQRESLRQLGESINYNAYGDDESDVYIAPSKLYALMAPYSTPLFFLEHEGIAHRINTMRRADLALAQTSAVLFECTQGHARLLYDAPWSRRVMGTFANALAAAEPLLAHAVLRQHATGDFVVSVRAPLVRGSGASTLCTRFGGSGRAGAAGIDHLPQHKLGQFLDAFATAQWGLA